MVKARRAPHVTGPSPGEGITAARYWNGPSLQGPPEELCQGKARVYCFSSAKHQGSDRARGPVSTGSAPPRPFPIFLAATAYKSQGTSKH